VCCPPVNKAFRSFISGLKDSVARSWMNFEGTIHVQEQVPIDLVFIINLLNKVKVRRTKTYLKLKQCEGKLWNSVLKA